MATVFGMPEEGSSIRKKLKKLIKERKYWPMKWMQWSDPEAVEEETEETKPDNGYNVTEMDMPMLWRSEEKKPE